MLPAEKKAFLVRIMGQERADDIEEALSLLSKELESAGVAFKDLFSSPKVADPRIAGIVKRVEELEKLLGKAKHKEPEGVAALIKELEQDPTGVHLVPLIQGRRLPGGSG